MVHLNRIYTKSGDQGQTSLGDGSRVSKTHERIVAYGTVDELNAVIGIVIASADHERIKQQLRQVQNDLFDLGADLCIPEQDGLQQNDCQTESPRLCVMPSHVANLEAWIDSANEELRPLDSFILPGGNSTAAHLHHARTVCRRSEIAVLQLAKSERINAQIAIYLNRLSDFMFIAARVCNNNGKDDILWVPGASMNSAEQ